MSSTAFKPQALWARFSCNFLFVQKRSNRFKLASFHRQWQSMTPLRNWNEFKFASARHSRNNADALSNTLGQPITAVYSIWLVRDDVILETLRIIEIRHRWSRYLDGTVEITSESNPNDFEACSIGCSIWLVVFPLQSLLRITRSIQCSEKIKLLSSM